MDANGVGGRTVVGVVVATLLVAAVLGPVGTGAAAATPGEGEPNDSRETATAVTPGTAVTGTVASGGDVDWFAVEVQAGETINATLTAGAGTNDFKIYRPGGGFVADTDVSGDTESIGLTARTTGTYHLRVRAEGEGADYTLRVTTSSADGFEPNERRANATPIEVGVSRSGTIPIGDVDWFSFTAERGRTINATLTAGAGTNDFKIYRPGGGFVADTDVSGGTESIGLTARTTGTYHVRVRAEGEGADYTFRVETTETDAFEPNERRANATPIETGVEQSGTIPIGDVDWFSFTAERGRIINATLTAGAGTNDFKIYRPNGGFVADTDVSDGTGTIGTTARSSGTYYVRVRAEGEGADYTFRVETTETDAFEPNEARANATPIETGVEQSGTITIGDVDWFAVEVERGETIRATMTAGAGTNDFKIYRPNGGFVADTDVSDGTGTIGTTARSSGTYYVRVRAEGEGADYSFRVETTETDGFEPNEARANATPIEAGVERSGTISIGDVDWFAIDLTAGQTINATLTAGAGTNDFKIYRPGGGFVADTDVSDGTATLNATAETDGTYYLRVRPEGDGADYTLLVEVSGGDGGLPAPGFTAGLAALAVLATLVVLARRRR